MPFHAGPTIENRTTIIGEPKHDVSINLLQIVKSRRSIPAMTFSALKSLNTWQPSGHRPDRGCTRLFAALYSIEGLSD